MAHAQLPPSKNTSAYRDPRVPFLLQPGDNLVNCPYEPSHWVLEPKFHGHLTKCRHNYSNNIKAKKIVVTALQEIVVCPYEYCHHMKQTEMESHMKNCSNNPLRYQISAKLGMEKTEKLEEYFKDMKTEGGMTTVLPGNLGDPSVGPYGEANNSSAGFWQKKEKDASPPVDKDSKPRRKKHEPETAEPEVEENWEIGVEEKDKQNKRFSNYNPVTYMSDNKGFFITNPQGLTKSERRAYHADTKERLLMEQSAKEEQEMKRAAELAALNCPPEPKRWVLQMGKPQRCMKEIDEDDDDDSTPVTSFSKTTNKRHMTEAGSPGYGLSLDVDLMDALSEQGSSNQD